MSNLTSRSVLVDLLRPYRLRIVIAVIALVIAATSMLGVGQALRLVIDKGFSQGDPAWLDKALLGMFGVIALLAAALARLVRRATLARFGPTFLW